jgi:hypothetical protein
MKTSNRSGQGTRCRIPRDDRAPQRCRLFKRSLKSFSATIRAPFRHVPAGTHNIRSRAKWFTALVATATMIVTACGGKSSSGPTVDITGTYSGWLTAAGRNIPLSVAVAQSGKEMTGMYSAANGFDSGTLEGQFVADFLIRGRASSVRLHASNCPFEAVTCGFGSTITQLTGTISCPGVTGVATFQVSR